MDLPDPDRETALRALKTEPRRAQRITGWIGFRQNFFQISTPGSVRNSEVIHIGSASGGKCIGIREKRSISTRAQRTLHSRNHHQFMLVLNACEIGVYRRISPQTPAKVRGVGTAVWSERPFFKKCPKIDQFSGLVHRLSTRVGRLDFPSRGGRLRQILRAHSSGGISA